MVTYEERKTNFGDRGLHSTFKGSVIIAKLLKKGGFKSQVILFQTICLVLKRQQSLGVTEATDRGV